MTSLCRFRDLFFLVYMDLLCSLFNLSCDYSFHCSYRGRNTKSLSLFTGDTIYSSTKKNLSNSTLTRTGRGRRRAGGMTSSSSATSCNSCTDGVRDRELTFHGDHQASLRLDNGKRKYFLKSFSCLLKI